MNSKSLELIKIRTNCFRSSCLGLALVLLVACGSGDSASSGSSTGTTGVGGSTARMTIANGFLYAIAESTVQMFDIRTTSTPQIWANIPVDESIETLFPYAEHILIGAANGVFILDGSNPSSPEITEFPHATAQDPVVALNGYAYVTLRSDFNGVNELNIIDISDIKKPLLIDRVSMQHPSGLSIDGNYLFICDDRAGLKIFDVSDPASVQGLVGLPEVRCDDVIAQDNLLYVINDTQIAQYDYSNLPPTLVSKVGAGS